MPATNSWSSAAFAANDAKTIIVDAKINLGFHPPHPESSENLSLNRTTAQVVSKEAPDIIMHFPFVAA